MAAQLKDQRSSRCGDSLELSGGRDALGFLFLYELMTASLNVRILPADSPYVLGALLVRLMPSRDHRKRNPVTPAVWGPNPATSDAHLGTQWDAN